jgi:Kef-type K+ transport system membrane component KefB
MDVIHYNPANEHLIVVLTRWILKKLILNLAILNLSYRNKSLVRQKKKSHHAREVQILLVMSFVFLFALAICHHHS